MTESRIDLKFFVALFLAGSFLFLSCAAPRPLVQPKRTGSIGRPDDGALAGGRQMPAVPGARILNPDRSWGTEETISLLTKAIIETKNAFPDAEDVLVADISFEEGGPMRPHLSHQSGRDVDVSIFKTGAGSANAFTFITPLNMDVEKTWYFLETLLLTDRLQYALIDYELQEPIYRFVGLGYSEDRLDLWFQYPRGSSHRKGVIRHAAGHHDHIHLRFKCPEDDRYCEP